MSEYHRRWTHALGACGADVVLHERFEHTGPRHPRDNAHRVGAQHDGGKSQMPERVPQRLPVPGDKTVNHQHACDSPRQGDTDINLTRAGENQKL